MNISAGKPGAAGINITVLFTDLNTQYAQTFEVKIDGALTNGASAWVRNASLPKAGKQSTH
jgi:hypothetical protein